MSETIVRPPLEEILIDDVHPMALSELLAHVPEMLDERLIMAGRAQEPEFYRIDHEQGEARSYLALSTYVAAQNKGDIERRIYVIDIRDSERIGLGEVVHRPHYDSIYNCPAAHVTYTETENRHQGEGVGTQRIIALGRATMALIDQPLHSDRVMTKPARAVWAKLEQQGRAEPYSKDGFRRWKFLD